MESLEDMQSRHRKEQKDLQARVTQKKKGATKKTRKGVNSECEELERQLKEKHEVERAALSGEAQPSIEEASESEEVPQDDTYEVNRSAESLEKDTVSEDAPSSEGQPKKRNRQKERLARRAAEQDAAIEEAKREAAAQPDPKAIEKEKMQKAFKENGLVEKSIRPDGHCLFSAVADQLSQHGIPIGAESDAQLKEDQRYKVVRQQAARYIEAHADDFVDWMEEPLNHYVSKIRDTAEWGGHIELLALARTYNVEICVIRDGAVQKIEPEDEDSKPETIWLAYYLHGFGLGEHYNSLRKAP